MPLRVKCCSCDCELVLDDAFGGSYCRCRHCRSLVHVPRNKAVGAARRANRPEQPPFAGAREPAPAPVPVNVVTPSPTGLGYRAWQCRLHAAVATTVLIMTVGVGLTIIHLTSSPPLPQVVKLDMSEPLIDDNPDQYVASDDPAVAIRTVDPLENYIGFPLTGDTIGYVVDGDGSMADFIDRVAFITNTVNESEGRNPRRIGVVMATGREEIIVSAIAEPSTDLIGARTVLTSRLPAGRTDLSAALRKTVGWYADTLFLVLAKPLDDGEIADLAEIAGQSGAVMNVIGLGEAAQQDLSPLAEKTGGKYLPVTDEMLTHLAERTEQSRQARIAAEERR